MTRLRMLSAIGLAGVLAACASTPEIAWQPRADANLATDKAACTIVANELGIDSPGQNGDSRYGAAAALANRIDYDSVKGGAANRARDVVFADCMSRKGWMPK